MEVRMAERGRLKAALILTDEERDALARWARRPKSPQGLALRSKAAAGRGGHVEELLAHAEERS
jgi:hypothetical protein